VESIRAEGWLELHELLFAGSWREELGRFRSRCAFRGEPDAGRALRTSLQLLGGDFAAVEEHLLRNFRKYAHGNLPDGDSPWSLLALAKHHGLPTRLLDWTYSPYVALHFATADPACADEDAAVWCADFAGLKRHLPPRLRELLDDEGADAFSRELLDRAARSLRELDALAGGEPFALFFEPPSLDARIVNQAALFSLLSSPSARLDEWLERDRGLARRIEIPAGLKPEVRDKLDQANVTERVLFPGLDGLCRWLARYYGPRPAAAPYARR